VEEVTSPLPRRRFAALGPLLVAVGCASAGAPPPQVDFAPARAAVEAARGAGAAENAKEPLESAESHLKEAEALAAVAGKGAAERAPQAEALLRLATAEANGAASLAAARSAVRCPPVKEAVVPSCADVEGRLHRSEEDERRLEERITFLLKELELTETEVIRTRAKLKGQSREEVYSAIAEARILLRRMSDEKFRSPNLNRCQELLDKAEELVREDNFGGAAFLAMTAQDLIEQTRRLLADPAAFDRPAPKEQYIVASDAVNIRSEPSTTAAVVGRATHGARLVAIVTRGDWVKVTLGDLSGWVYRPLLE
jgi:SH3 domain-containing protein